jgi:hypothetical protein
MFDVVRDRCTPDEIVFICPQPGCGDSTGNRSVNLKSGKTSCWRCNIGGDFVKWARWIGFALEDSGEAGVTVEDLRAAIEAPTKPAPFVPVISEITLPVGFKTCYDNPDSVYTRLIGEMARRKNLEPEDLINAGVGYTNDMKSKWEPFAIFPVLEYGRTVYYQGRTYWDDPGVSTKRFPSRLEAPLSSKYWLYNIDALHAETARTAVVVESMLNVLSLQKEFGARGITDMVPVCAFKHAVSKPQFYKLLRFKHLTEVCLLFDFDAIELSWQDAKKIDNNIHVSIAEMPLNAKNPKFDPNDDVKAAMEAIYARKPFHLSDLTARRLQSVDYSFMSRSLSGQLIDFLHPVPVELSTK